MSVNKRLFIIDESQKDMPAGSAKRESELLIAAARVFGDKGFHDTKISDIVSRAGVAQGTFYLYFKNKNDIFFHLISNCCQRIVARLGSASEAQESIDTATDYRDNNFGFLIDMFHMLENEQSVLKLILSDTTGIDPAIDKMLFGLREALVELAQRNLELGIEAGYLRSCNPAIVAEAMVGMVYHLAFERFVRGRDLGVNLDELAKEIVELELQGVIKQLPKSP
jgi:TetR/AcrR family fatty acid metabolism transcriptional regulator